MQLVHRLLPTLLVLLGALPVLLGGCVGTNNPFAKDPDASSPAADDFVRGEPIHTDDFQFLWERTKMRMAASGYMVDDVRTSLPDRLIVSGWRTALATQRFKGRRHRVWVQFDDGADIDAATWVAAVAVQTQRNTEMEDPLSPVAADWEDDETDKARAGVLGFQIESDFRKQ